MKFVLLLLALLAALASVHGETKTLTTVGATASLAAASPTVTTIATLNTTSRVTTLNVTNVTANVTISGTGATGSFIGQPTIAGSRGGSVTIGTGNVSTASPSPSAAGNATLVGAAGPSSSAAPSGTAVLASPTASAAVIVSPTASAAAIVSASPAASGAASIAASPAASGAAATASPATSAAASGSPAASRAASVSASPAASGAASVSASPAASGGAVIISPSPSRSPAASGAASVSASPAASGAASISASPAASGAASISASPAASGAAVTASPATSAAASGSPARSPTRSPSPAASSGVVASASPAISGAASPAPSGTVSAGTVGSFFPAMPTYGEENFAFTCPNVTNETMVEVSFEPLLVGIDAVSSIKFAGCPALMYVATRSGRIFEVTLNNDSSAVEQVRLILDLSGQIFTSQASGAGASASPGPAASSLSASPSASSSSSSSSSSPATSSSPDQPGLLGIAFPPDFASSGLFYVYFSAQPTSGGASSTPASTSTTSGSGAGLCANESTLLNHVNRLAEYRLNSSSGIATFSRNLLELRWPFANGNADNSLEFAPGTRLLFVGVGDGGSSFDPFENAQNPDILLGKVHVLDLNSLSANASCNTTVLRLSELERSCPEIASATTIFATGMHAPAGFEFLSPPAESEGAACASGSAASGGANATASTNATSSGNNNATSLNSLAPRVIVPDRGQGRYEEVNIMEQIGANYGWDILEGWSCVDQSLDLCPTATSGPATANNASLAGGANATTAGANATASGNATLAGGNNATSAANNTGLSTTSSVLPAAVIPHNCRSLYSPQAVLGGRLYRGTELNPLLQGAYLFGATSSLQNGDEALPIGSGGLYFMRPESFAGNAVVDLGVCPAAGSGSAAGGGSNATVAGGGGGGSSSSNVTAGGAANNATSAAAGSGITSTGSGVNASFIPNSRLEVFPVTTNFQFFPTQHFFTAIGADASRTQLFVGVSSTETATGGVAGVFRLIPFNEGPLSPAVISATNLTPGQIVFSAANATATASPSPSSSPASSAAASPAV